MSESFSRSPYPKNPRIHLMALSGLLILSLVINVLQLSRRAIIEDQLVALTTKVNFSASTLKALIGSPAPPVDAHTLKGDPIQIEFVGSNPSLSTVIYVFTPQCQWCTKNLPNLQALAQQAKGRYRLLGVSLRTQDLTSYVAEHHIEFEVATDPTLQTVKRYGLGATPMTIIIDKSGVIRRIWRGAYSESTRQEISSELQVQLPGLLPTLEPTSR